MFEAGTVGAYIIRNRKTSKVLHIDDPTTNSSWNPVTLCEQDENQYHDQQIWWIEPVTHSDSKPKIGVYHITSPASGKYLTVGGYPGSIPAATNGCEPMNITATVAQGTPRQWWILQKIPNPDRVSYKILSGLNGRPIDYNPDPGCFTTNLNEESPDYQNNLWELVIPAIGYPAGWFHIQSVRSRDLLSHTYLNDLPVLLPSPTSPRPSQYREEWNLQWTISHAASWDRDPSFRPGSNAWCIVNRLTGGILSTDLSETKANTTCTLNAWRVLGEIDCDAAWKLELTASQQWKITNLNTDNLLEQTDNQNAIGIEVACKNACFATRDKNKCWVLTPPTLDVNDMPQSPPDYEALATSDQSLGTLSLTGRSPTASTL